MKYSFTAPFKPVPWERTGRRRLANGVVITYTKHTTRNAEDALRRMAIAERLRPLQGPVRLSVTVYLARPASHTRAQREVPYVTTKPDWDNYGKLVSDALNGIAWKDDGQVSIGTVEKLYIAEGEHERWEILVEELLPAEAAA